MYYPPLHLLSGPLTLHLWSPPRSSRVEGGQGRYLKVRSVSTPGGEAGSWSRRPPAPSVLRCCYSLSSVSGRSRVTRVGSGLPCQADASGRMGRVGVEDGGGRRRRQRLTRRAPPPRPPTARRPRRPRTWRSTWGTSFGRRHDARRVGRPRGRRKGLVCPLFNGEVSTFWCDRCPFLLKFTVGTGGPPAPGPKVKRHVYRQPPVTRACDTRRGGNELSCVGRTDLSRASSHSPHLQTPPCPSGARPTGLVRTTGRRGCQ